jgi:hypothetical protein
MVQKSGRGESIQPQPATHSEHWTLVILSSVYAAGKLFLACVAFDRIIPFYPTDRDFKFQSSPR